MSACPRDLKGGLGDVEGSLGFPERERLAEPGACRRGQVRQMNFLRSFQGGFEERDGGFEFTIERMSVPSMA